MSKRSAREARRQQLDMELEQVRKTLSSYRPLDQAQRAALVNTAHRLVSATHEQGNQEAWQEALALFRRALDIAYPAGIWAGYARLQAGDPAGLEIAVEFLEHDPWFFRSGYTKAALLTCIKRLDIPARYMPRLERVLLTAVDYRDRREFRQFCHLARAIQSDSLRRELTARLASDDAGIRRRAGWMLAALDQG